MDGDSLPVSAFMPHVDGQFELGAAAYEKRGVAVSVPTWDARQVHPVQQLRLCLPACHHPSLRSDRGGGQERSRQLPRSSTSRPARARVFTSTPWPSLRSTAWAAASASASARSSALTMVAQEAELRSRMCSTTAWPRSSDKKDMQDTPSRAASSSSPCSSSPAPAPAAPRPAMPVSSPSCSATVCTSPTPPAAPPSGAVRRYLSLLHR